VRNLANATLVSLLVIGLSTACAMRQKRVEQQLAHPQAVDCATAEGDLRMLEHEKAHVAERIAEGVTAIYPAGLVIGLVTRTEGTKIKVAIGSYNDAIDKRIAHIKQECGLE
jgi:hypothetical protein